MKKNTLLGIFLLTTLAGSADTTTFRWTNGPNGTSKYFEIPPGKVVKEVGSGISSGVYSVELFLEHEGEFIKIPKGDSVSGPARIRARGGLNNKAFVTLEIADQKTPPSSVVMKDE